MSEKEAVRAVLARDLDALEESKKGKSDLNLFFEKISWNWRRDTGKTQRNKLGPIGKRGRMCNFGTWPRMCSQTSHHYEIRNSWKSNRWKPGESLSDGIPVETLVTRWLVPLECDETRTLAVQWCDSENAVSVEVHPWFSGNTCQNSVSIWKITCHH